MKDFIFSRSKRLQTDSDPPESPVPSFPDGVKILHDCPEATVDICFIHGLTGDRDNTWTAHRQSTPWPKTLLPSKLEKSRILTYGYDAYVVRKGTAGSGRLIDHATNLLHDLTTDRTSCNASTRPLIFIAHSLGGLVCKEAILLSRNNPERHLRGIFDHVKGIIFMGTPHSGSWMADWAKIPVSALGLMKSTNKSLLETLETDNQQLESVQVRFLSMVRELREDGRCFEVTCFFEELPLPIAGIVVSKKSATFEGYNTITIHADHRDMVRFAFAEDNGFKRFVGELVRWKSQVRHLHASQTDGPSRMPPPLAEGSQGTSSVNYYGSIQNINSITTGPSPAYVAQHQTINQTFVQDTLKTVPNRSQDCLMSLAFPKMQDRSIDIDRAITGTCEWLLRHEMYKSWSTRDQGLLWIKGKPGSGKSTLLKYALNNREAIHNDLILSFFFHGRGDELQRTPLGFFRSLLHQLLSQVPGSLQGLVDTFEKRQNEVGEAGEKWEWHQKELQHFFELSLPKILEVRSVWLFVDALDESGEENAVDLAKQFKSLFKGLAPVSSRLHICFTCRHYPILDPYCELEICLENENKKDISTFVDDQLSEFCMRTSSTITALITARASGIFMWARLVVNEVLDLEREGETLEIIEDKIRSLHPNLNDLYKNLLKNMGSASKKLIKWICFATRPLSLDELRWAMVVEPDCSLRSLQEYQSTKDYISENDRMRNKVHTLTHGLAEVVPSSGTREDRLKPRLRRRSTPIVQFIHQSVRDFFFEEGLLTLHSTSASTDEAIGMAHYQLSEICIRYLAMEEVSQSTSYENDDFPFLLYATTSWVSHVRQCDARVVVPDDILELFGWPSNDLVDLWVHVYHTVDRTSGRCPPYGTRLIHVMSMYGILGPLTAICQRVNQGSGDVDSRDKRDLTVLSRAVRKVETLLAMGKLDVDMKDEFSCRTPLSYAAENGHEAIVKTLLTTGKVDIDTKDLYGMTPLLYAAQNGHETIVKALLATGKVNVDVKDKSLGQTPLSCAAANGHEAIVKALLATGKANVDVKNKTWGRTPLSYAAQNGHEAIFKALLATGKANVDVKDKKWGQTPLSYAAENEHEAIVKTLLATGKVDIDTKSVDDRTPLLYAARNGYETIVKTLLATGKVDIDIKDLNGKTPLLYATERGHETIVKALLAHRQGQC